MVEWMENRIKLSLSLEEKYENMKINDCVRIRQTSSSKNSEEDKDQFIFYKKKIELFWIA